MLVAELFRVPLGIEPIVPLVQHWGILDDVDRSSKVGSATRSELQELVAGVRAVDADILYGWLEGPESCARCPSDAYVHVSALIMAFEEAKVILAR
jgi:hypothetical protein